MPESERKYSLIKPTTDTPFKIDFDWWKESDSNWRIFLLGFLCEEHKQTLSQWPDSQLIDAVDPETAEVSQVDGLLYTLVHHCAKSEDFIRENLPLVSQIFRVFLANGNKPLTPNDLSKLVNKPPRTILVTIGGHRVYKGIRPVQE